LWDYHHSTDPRRTIPVAKADALPVFRDTLAADEGGGTGNPWLIKKSGTLTKDWVDPPAA